MQVFSQAQKTSFFVSLREVMLQHDCLREDFNFHPWLLAVADQDLIREVPMVRPAFPKHCR